MSGAVRAMNILPMNTLTIFRRRAAYLLAAAMVFGCRMAEACPGCKQAIGGDGAGGSTQVSSVGIAYALSIGFLLFMIFAALGLLGYLGYRNCRVLAAHQAAALREA